MRKTFCVSRLELSWLLNLIGTLNSRKIGKHRRGSLLLTGHSATRLESGDWLVELLWKQARRLRVPGAISKLNAYEHTDHGKLIKTLKGLACQ